MPRRTARVKRGGAAIAAGGFGCVFRPALRCKAGSPDEAFYDPTDVSKLMAKRDAEEEIKEISKVVPVLRLIPDAARYFMGVGAAGGFYACEPAPLTAADKLRYDTCRPLIRRGFTAENINTKLAALRTINQTDGGLELNKAWGIANHAGTDSWAAAMLDSTTGFHAINASLQRLLVHGVVPLNKLGVLHGDLKAANVLVAKGPAATRADSPYAADSIHRLLVQMTATDAADPDMLSTRIIDWGLAMYFKAPSGPMSSLPPGVPISLRQGKYTNFNMPVTAILLDDAIRPIIRQLVLEFLPSGNVGLGRLMAMRNVANRVYLIHLRAVDGHGHDEYLAQILRGLFYGVPLSPEDTGVDAEQEASPQDIIIDYLAAALDAYVDANGNFQQEEYFDKVFRHNCDVYGLLTCYLPLVETPGDVSVDETWSRNRLANDVVRILAEYCYGPTYAAQPIPVGRLVADLGSLSQPATRRQHHRARPPPPVVAAPPASGRRRRCPKGTRRDKATGRCLPKRTSRRPRSSRAQGSAPRLPASSGPTSIALSPGRKCPKGYRRKKSTGKCHRTRKN